MPPLISTNWQDLVDRRFTRIFHETYKDLPSMLAELFTMTPARKGPDERFSQAGTLPDFTEFSGTVNYQDSFQGFDVTATHKEFASGIQTQRKLVDDDLFSIIDNMPRELATSAARSREADAARLFNLANSVDTKFYNHSEAVALVSNSHTTTTGASTASGFDNLVTTGLSATALASARIQMRGFRGDQAQRIDVMPSELWIPPDLYEQAYEIVAALGKVDQATNNPNVHYGQYTVKEWNYLTDVNNWFLCDEGMRRRWVLWFDRVKLEFARAEDMDTLVMKHRAYQRYSYLYRDWRWVLGGIVS